jgi:hypothetical protein
MFFQPLLLADDTIAIKAADAAQCRQQRDRRNGKS